MTIGVPGDEREDAIEGDGDSAQEIGSSSGDEDGDGASVGTGSGIGFSPVVVGAVAVAGVAVVGMVVAVGVALRLRGALQQQNRVSPDASSAPGGGADEGLPSVGEGIDYEVESDSESLGSSVASGSDVETGGRGAQSTGGAASVTGAGSPRVFPRAKVSMTDQRTPSRVDLLRPGSMSSSSSPLGSANARFQPLAPLGSSSSAAPRS